MFMQMCVPSYLWQDMNMQKEGYRSFTDVRYLMLQWLLSGIPLLCLWRYNDRRIGSICSHCLDFPAVFLCRKILLRSICPLFFLFHKVLNGSTHKDGLGGEHTTGVSFAPAGFCPTPVFSECREKHECSPYRTSTKALWGFANSPCVVGISLWLFIMRSGIFYSRPAQNFVTRFTKTLVNKRHVTIFAFCGVESKKSLLFVELNDQELYLAFITFPFLLW